MDKPAEQKCKECDGSEPTCKSCYGTGYTRMIYPSHGEESLAKDREKQGVTDTTETEAEFEIEEGGED